MISLRNASISMALVLMLAGCNLLKKKVPDAGPDADIADSAVADAADDATVDEPDAAPPAATTDPDWVPGNVDDDTKAKKDITKATYKQELDAVEKEINTE